MSRLARALADAPPGPPLAEREAFRARFVARRDRDDHDTVAYWRSASAQEHADAMCALSDYAVAMAAQTGPWPRPDPAPVLARLMRGGVESSRLSTAVERDGQARSLWDGVHVDLFFADTDFHASMAARVERRPFVDRQARVLSIEDLLICKVPFDRPKDWVDIAAVVAHEGDQLDASYMATWLLRALPDDDPRIARIAGLL